MMDKVLYLKSILTRTLSNIYNIYVILYMADTCIAFINVLAQTHKFSIGNFVIISISTFTISHQKSITPVIYIYVI